MLWKYAVVCWHSHHLAPEDLDLLWRALQHVIEKDKKMRYQYVSFNIFRVSVLEHFQMHVHVKPSLYVHPKMPTLSDRLYMNLASDSAMMTAFRLSLLMSTWDLQTQSRRPLSEQDTDLLTVDLLAFNMPLHTHTSVTVDARFKRPQIRKIWRAYV